MFTSHPSLQIARNLLIATALVICLTQAAAPSFAAPGSPYTVNTTLDPGSATCTAAACSLRAAISASNADGPSASSNILFDLVYPATITLTSSLPPITGTLVISGPGAANLAINGSGSRVFTVSPTGNLTITGITITQGNDVIQGGGILVDHGRLVINDSLFLNNLSSGNGGGLYNEGGTVDIANTTFSDNHSFDDGAIGNSGTMTVTDSLFIDSLARTAGAIHIYPGGSLVITNSTFTGNDASQTGGGAILNQGALVVANSTFDNNGALNGADIANGGAAHITNSTLANADPRSHNSIDSPGASASLTLRNSIVAAGAGIANCTAAAGVLDVDASNLATDSTCASATVTTTVQLNLGILHYNLGSTPTIAPLPGSAAIDAGVDATCAAATGAPGYGAGGQDQRGILRPQGAHCDVGAVEYLAVYTIYLPISLR